MPVISALARTMASAFCRAAKSHGLPVSLQVFALTSRSHGGSLKSHGCH